MEKFGLKKVVGLITQAFRACVRLSLPYSRLSLPYSRLSLGAAKPSLPYFPHYLHAALQRPIATVKPLDSTLLSVLLFPPFNALSQPLNALFIYITFTFISAFQCPITAFKCPIINILYLPYTALFSL